LKLTIKYKKFLFLIITAFIFYGCKDNLEIVLTKYPNGQVHELLILNKPITKDSLGIKKVFFENGKLQCSGPILNNKRNGLWTCYYPNDSIEWRATYKMEVSNGEVFCRYKNGTWRKMTLVNGIKSGKTVEYNYDSVSKQYYYIHGFYGNNLEQGLWTKTDINGILLIEMTFVNGERVGYFTNRYKNGQIRLKGELQKDRSMRNFTFYDSTGKQTTQDSYIIEPI
jgi:antitoxin component YwqK of YwqJK toxin-antitoxin module